DAWSPHIEAQHRIRDFAANRPDLIPRSEIHLFERALAGPLAARIRRCDHRPPIRPQGVSPRPDTDRLMRASRYGNLETISHLKFSHWTAQIAQHHHRTLGHPQTASGKQ